MRDNRTVTSDSGNGKDPAVAEESYVKDKGSHAQEARYLAKTVEFIDREVQKMKDRSPARGPYKEDARSLQEKDDKALSDYERIRPRPYFGRIDFQQENKEQSDKRYIGTDHIHNRVYSWASPFAEQLYYADPGSVRGYEAPKGHIAGAITLKRNFVIDNAELLEVRELYRRAISEDGEDAVSDSSRDFMVESLSGHRDRMMHEVVATIQPQQYEQIAAALGDVMLVQGVAGSGKSIVGLHRIAYLLSPFNKRRETRGMASASVAFFGPTRAFLDYVGGLLPSLNVREVPQMTVIGWLQSTLSRKIFLDRREPLIEKLLRHKGKKWADSYAAAKLKGSVPMARLLERHVESLRRSFKGSVMEVAAEFDSKIPIKIDAKRLKKLVRSLPDAPLNSQRDDFIDRIVQIAWDEYFTRNSYLTRDVRRSRRPDFLEQVRPQIARQVSVFWPAVDFRKEYRAVISNADLLSHASRGRLGLPEAAVLSTSLPTRPNVFSPEDLGALCYLDHLLTEHPGTRFNHVVLDEAQEISPIELMVIMQHTNGNAFTILGDLTQSLSPKGIDSWAEILRLFRTATVARYHVRTSYRPTREICRFSNRILKKVSPNAVTAVPFDRPGHQVRLTRSENYNEMVSAIAADIHDLRDRGAETIGVLCKTSVDAKKLHAALGDAGITRLGVLGKEEDAFERVVVGPVSLTRGLEFDAVILAGAGKANYPVTPLHGRILYLAVSRAVHELRIHAIGAFAEQLAVPKRKMTKRVSKRRRAPAEVS